jgi:hypothetical protein
METHHFSSKELEFLQRSHSLSRCLDVSKYNMGLPPHLHGPQRNDIEDGTVGGEKSVE